MRRKAHARRAALFGLAVTLGAMLAVAWLGPSPGTAQTTTIVVDSLDDDVGVAGKCTLREAMENAIDGEATHPGCAAGSDGANTITFAPGLSGTITLNGSQLPTIAIDSVISIQGGGEITIDGAGESRHFWVFGDLTLDGLTLQNGSADGGGSVIMSAGKVTIEDSTFSGNVATSESPGGGSGMGGAILKEGDLIVRNSTFSDNEANLGAAISQHTGTMTIVDSTFSGNTATEAANEPFGHGGAIENVWGTVRITNSVFEDNYAANLGGAIVNYHGSVQVSESTFLRNSVPSQEEPYFVTSGGGAISNADGDVTVSDSIFEENAAPNGGAIANGGSDPKLGIAELTVLDSSFEANIAAGEGGAIFVEDGAFSVERSTLSDNSSGYGGAIANGPDGEATVTDSEIIDNLVGRVGAGIHNDGSFTLSNSIVSSNEAPYHHSGGIYNGGAHEDGEWVVRATMTITGSTVSDNFAGGSINFDEELIGDPLGGGGGITNLGELSLTDSTVSGNSAPTGGGINNFGGILTLTNSTVSGNDALLPGEPITHANLEGRGGGVFNGGMMDVVESTFAENDAFEGGAVASKAFEWQGLSFEGVLSVEGSTLTGNNAAGGGGIANGGEVTVTASELTENGAGLGAGAITNDGSFTLADSEVTGNHAYHGSGGIFNSGMMTITASTISENFGGATDHPAASLGVGGGGIGNWGDGSLTLTRSEVRGNSTSLGGQGEPGGKGGGILNLATLEVVDSVFADNSAASGGAIANLAFQTGADEFDVGTLDVTGTEVSGNSAMRGAAIFVSGSEAQADLVNSTLSGNTAENTEGGTARVEVGGTLDLTHVTLWDGRGGGLVNEDGTVTTVNSIVFACSGTIEGTHNLALTGSGCPTGAFTLVDDLHLGPLQDNGGPTETHRPLLGSAAIHAANHNSCPAVDQRGVPRPQPPEGTCDIGSVEVTLDDVAGDLAELAETVDALQSTQNVAEQIEASIERGNNQAACGQLTGFINQVEAQSGRRLSEDDANTLIDAAEQLQVRLEC